MNVHFKRFVICCSIVGFLALPFRPQTTYADGGVLELAAGAALAPEILPVLTFAAIGICGYYVVTTYGDDVVNYVKNSIINYGANKLINIYKDGSGKTYAGFNSDGVDYVQSTIKSMKSKNTAVSGSYTPNSSYSNYTDYNFWFSATGLNSINSCQKIFHIKANDTFFVTVKTGSSTYSTSKFSPTSDTYYMVFPGDYDSYYHQQGIKVYSGSSYAESSNGYSTFQTVAFISSSTSWSVGYKTSSGSVLSNSIGDAITGTGIEGNASSNVGAGNAVAVPISGQYDASKGETVYAPIDGAVTAGVVNGVKAVDLSGAGAGAGTDTQTGFWDKLWDWLQSIIDGIKAIPSLILDWFTIDWDKVKTHINYIDIVKQHFQPIYDIFDLISNVSADIKDSDGKFYMVIPHEMGGDDQEHCVLDLSVGAVYITTARDVIKYGMWMGFVWYVFRKFDPKFSI
ncbi:hypothetical protein [Clostridium diolis]|uniref:hypothetical protein n=1 Tax=Clostridium diolis TaxID=223919 RepID=UPI003AF6CD1A